VTPEQLAEAVAAGLEGAEVTREARTGEVTVDVAADGWLAALAFARDDLGCDFFDWLTAVDEEERGLAVVAHVYSVAGRHRVLIRTLVPPGQAVLPTATGIYRGADWHERETREMFGLEFDGHPDPAPLLLPDGFEGHPLRKDFVLAARATRDWPGAKEPGDRDPARTRRRLPPPGLPESWRPS
jgi:NADH-quinone oxidoreductase subunit C